MKNLIKRLTALLLVLAMSLTPTKIFADDSNLITTPVNYVANNYYHQYTHEFGLEPRIILKVPHLAAAAKYLIGGKPVANPAVVNGFISVVNGVQKSVRFEQTANGLWRTVSHGLGSVSNFFFQIVN
ncbi:MAG: hypothetical protein FWG63_09325 [Defluviitaleaceae bacterium]|nr:hypothetical protein [Defluviitaleaceae bacterium]